MRPISLPANQTPDVFYRGGRRIAEFRGLQTWKDFTPEDWVGSVTPVAGRAPIGLTVLDDGRMLADAIAQDPLPWLGPDHVRSYGTDTMLLVKLLHAGERLPIHAHPDDAFAATHLGKAHGKAEAWYILDPGTVHLGLKESLSREDLLGLIAEQRVDTLLERMHRLDLDAGDTVYVPPGTLHAIGADTFLMEVQEPADVSILIEWRGFALDGAKDGHLGVGFDLVTRAISTAAMSTDDVGDLVVRQAGPGQTLSPRSAHYFRLELATAGSTQAAGFAIAVAHRGPAVLRSNGLDLVLPAGSTTLIPYGYGDYQVAAGSILLGKPPRID